LPELPEVETIARDLRSKVLNKRIRTVRVNNPSYLEKRGGRKIKPLIEGAKFVEVSRRGKFLITKLSNGQYLIMHLGMTGQLIYNPLISQEDKYTPVSFIFADNSQLFFRDARKFGRINIAKDQLSHPSLQKLGPEPLENDFTAPRLVQLLKKRPRSKIKPLLMDQTFLAGIGNIYASESLFRAGIHPERKAGSLREKEVVKLHKYLREVLQEAIRERGTSVSTYRDGGGKKGNFASKLKVYGRKGETCCRCKAVIEAKSVAGRTTYFCPKCQVKD